MTHHHQSDLNHIYQFEHKNSFYKNGGSHDTQKKYKETQKLFDFYHTFSVKRREIIESKLQGGETHVEGNSVKGGAASMGFLNSKYR